MVATLELLNELKREGYIALVRKYRENTFKPVKGELGDIIGSLSNTPSKEDVFVCIDMAITEFDEQDSGRFLISME